MTIICPKCKARLKLSDEKARQEGTKIRCAKCGVVLVYKGKGRREAPEREEETDTTLQPPLAAGIADSQGGTEAEDISAREEPSSKVPLHLAASGISAVREQAPVGTPDKEQIRKTLEKTTAVREAEKVLPGAGEGRKKTISGKAVLAGSAFGVLVLLLIAVFIFRSPEMTSQKQPVPAPPEGGERSSQPSGRISPQESPPIASPAVPPAEVPAVQSSSAPPEEKAVEMVKRSDVLMKMTSVEAIVNKWTQDNAGKYKVVGWQTKKIDEKQYLVSYTALEGDTPKGFYFVADIQAGTVEDLAHYPELQKKYNIQYSR